MKPTIDLEPWTERTLALSTAHWPGPETCDQLAEALGSVDYMPHDYGGRVLLAFLDADDAEATLGELPEPVAAILRAAHAQGFRWVDYDADADICPAFPSFDW